jgi:hypothetical protein
MTFLYFKIYINILKYDIFMTYFKIYVFVEAIYLESNYNLFKIYINILKYAIFVF